MLNKLLSLLKKNEKEEGSRERMVSEQMIKEWTSNPDFPFLVSFPRTGSHWLRMLMELYLENPSMRLLFFKKTTEVSRYTCFHTHDLDLEVQRKNVIYLYRDPAATIYSQMSYHKQSLQDISIVKEWASLYSSHLAKWLIEDDFTEHKTVIKYERLRSNLIEEFSKVALFFNTHFDEKHFSEIAVKASKETIKEKTAHDQQVIQLNTSYQQERKHFISQYGNLVNDILLEQHSELEAFLKS